METLLLDPQTEPQVVPQARPVRSAAGRSVLVNKYFDPEAPSWKDQPESTDAGPVKTPPPALSSEADETQVYPCPGLASTEETLTLLRRILIVLGALLISSGALLLPSYVDASGWWLCGGCVVFVVLLLAAKNTSRRPCEIHIGRDWAEFVSLIERRRVHVSDVCGIVRHEPQSQPGRLGYLVVQLSSGPVMPRTSHEGIFKALTRFSPAARVTIEEYNDSPDPY